LYIRYEVCFVKFRTTKSKLSPTTLYENESSNINTKPKKKNNHKRHKKTMFIMLCVSRTRSLEMKNTLTFYKYWIYYLFLRKFKMSCG